MTTTDTGRTADEELREFRKQLALACNDPGHFVGFKGERSLGQWQTDALLAGPLAQLQSDLKAVRDERDEARRENDYLRASLANGGGPCAYCKLPKDDWAKCASGFPGCDRADDAMLCPHVGGELEAEANLIALAKMYGEACGELQVLRGIVSDSAAAIGNGACVSPACSLEFMSWLPKEIAGVTGGLRTQLAEAQKAVSSPTIQIEGGDREGA